MSLRRGNGSHLRPWTDDSCSSSMDGILPRNRVRTVLAPTLPNGFTVVHPFESLKHVSGNRAHRSRHVYKSVLVTLVVRSRAVSLLNIWRLLSCIRKFATRIRFDGGWRNETSSTAYLFDVSRTSTWITFEYLSSRTRRLWYSLWITRITIMPNKGISYL